MADLSTLKRGMQGPMVLQLQKKLNQLGISVTEDSSYGPKCEAAVKVFQKSQHLVDDGVCGPQTWKELDEAIAALKAPVKPVPAVEVCLEVPYHSQRDNSYAPGGTCNVTSLSMVLSYYGVKPKVTGGQLEDELFQVLLQPEAQAYFKKNFPDMIKQGFNPRNVHGMLTWLAKHYGFKARFSTNETWDQIRGYLRKGIPVIMSGAFTGSGHIICVVGFTANNDLIVHDPWGDWTQGYRGDTGKDGAFKIYPFDHVNDVLKLSGQNAKWAHIVEKP